MKEVMIEMMKERRREKVMMMMMMMMMMMHIPQLHLCSSTQGACREAEGMMMTMMMHHFCSSTEGAQEREGEGGGRWSSRSRRR
mgnify:CR=1 FL=1